MNRNDNRNDNRSESAVDLFEGLDAATVEHYLLEAREMRARVLSDMARRAVSAVAGRVRAAAAALAAAVQPTAGPRRPRHV